MAWWVSTKVWPVKCQDKFVYISRSFAFQLEPLKIISRVNCARRTFAPTETETETIAGLGVPCYQACGTRYLAPDLGLWVWEIQILIFATLGLGQLVH